MGAGVVMAAWGNGLALVSRAAGDDHREWVTLSGQAVAVTLILVMLLGARRFSPAELGFTPARLRGPAATVLALAAVVVAVALVVAVVRGASCATDGGLAVNLTRLEATTGRNR